MRGLSSNVLDHWFHEILMFSNLQYVCICIVNCTCHTVASPHPQGRHRQQEEDRL